MRRENQPKSHTVPNPLEAPAPHLLVEWPSWWKVFLRNLADLFRRPQPPSDPSFPSSRPAPFWPDVFVDRRLPVAPFRRSLLGHILILVALWGVSKLDWMHPELSWQTRARRAASVYYPISEYLPAIGEESEDAAPRPQKKGAPAFARQHIRSTPPHPDNTEQTIITPKAAPAPPLTIRQPQALPNIVAWTTLAALAPALPRASAIHLPAPPPAQAAPTAPQPARAHLSVPAVPAPAPVAPPVKPAIPPPPQISDVRKPGELNVAPMFPTVAPPRLPEPAQQAMWVKSGRPGAHARQSQTASPAPVLPSRNGAAAVGQIVALSLNPAVPTGPVVVPHGNRHGEFEAGPQGKPGAPGTPDFAAKGKTEGHAASGPGLGKDSRLAGITVAPGPANPGPIAAAGPANVLAPSAIKPTSPAPRSVFTTMRRSSGMADIAGRTHPANSPASAPEIEDPVFGPKRFYRMVLNMPNFNSSGGSWIMRFAERKQTAEKGELVPPEAMVKIDPAYPTEWKHEGVEGVVELFAVIHADGSVGEIRVLNGADRRLDASASAALGRWRFRPATKNGNPVELEADIKIPFRASGGR